MCLFVRVFLQQLAQSRLYSATGWDAIYGGKGAVHSSDGWGDDSGQDNTGAQTNVLHETDGDSDDDVDPDSAKGDVHWNAAGSSKTATSDDDSDDSSSDASSKRASMSPGSSSKKVMKQEKAKNGKPTKTDALEDLSKSFDKGLPTPKSRAEEKQQNAEQLANLLRIQKELSSDYKVCTFSSPIPTSHFPELRCTESRSNHHAHTHHRIRPCPTPSRIGCCDGLGRAVARHS